MESYIYLPLTFAAPIHVDLRISSLHAFMFVWQFRLSGVQSQIYMQVGPVFYIHHVCWFLREELHWVMHLH